MTKILLKNPKKSFTKGKNWLKTMAMLLFFMVLSITNANAQITFNVTGNTNTTPNLATYYTSLDNLLTAVNAVTAVSGNVLINGNSGSETAPAKGFTIGSATLNAAMEGNAFSIYISGSGTCTINAGVGNATPSSASPDGMVKLVGANNINFSSFVLIDGNTTNPATMEFGIGLFKASTTDGCNNTILLGNNINMQRGNFSAGGGVMPTGATGIVMVNATPTAANTLLTPTSVAGANYSNNITQNTISGGNNGIYILGYSGVSPYTFADTNNEITNNTILNFGGTTLAAITAYGITAISQWNVKINYNNIDNSGSGLNTAFNLYGIALNLGGNNANTEVLGNILKLQTNAVNTPLYGIYNNTGAGTGSTNINDNSVQLGKSLSTTGLTCGIYNVVNSTVLNINNNTIEGIAGVPIGGTGNILGIASVAASGTVNTNSNIIRNIVTTGDSGVLRGFQINATNWNASGNTIENLTFSATASIGNIIAMYSSGANVDLTNNTIKNLSVPFTGTIYGINTNSNAGIKTIRGNQINNFSTSAGGTGGSNYIGILCSVGTVNINNNTIHSLNITGNNTANSSARGIRLESDNHTVHTNKIYNLSVASPNGSVEGISASTGTSLLYNNLISDLRAPNSSFTSAVNGVLCNGSVSLYYNTIVLNETVKNFGNSGSTALFSNTAGTFISRNNILINKSVISGTGRAIALNCSNFATTYDASSNNNLLNAPTIFVSGGVSDATLAAFKTRMVTRDQNSVTETNTPFTSTDGSNVDFLRLADGVVSVANNAGMPISTPAITTDYFGVTRDATTPDIGASEFAGALLCSPPTITSNPPNRTICASGYTTFSFAATGATAYQWQENSGSGFVNITDGGNYSGATTTILTITGATAGMSGYLYRAIAINDVATCFTNSNESTLTISNTTSTGSQTNVTCFGGSDGVASVLQSGGIAPYTYLWSNGATTQSITGLIAGVYELTITDNIGCTAIRSFTITQPNVAISGTTVVSNVSCFGGSNGTIDLTPTGGTAPYTYYWSDGITTEDRFTGLVAGTYSVTITDANGCTETVNVTITQPTAAISGTSVVSNVSCFEVPSGTINLTPTGGTAPYTYYWSDGITTEDRIELSADNYSVTITDFNGCTGTVNVTVTEPTTTVSGTTVVTNVACFGGSNGTVNLTPTGGNAPYTTYLWSDGITTEDRTGLTAGTYYVLITDSNGCTRAVEDITVTEPSAIDATVSQNAGILTANQSGATYQWYLCPNTILFGETNQSFTPLTIGDYKVEIMVAGCMVTSACETVSVLGNTNFDTTEFSYYPNPVIDNLNITYNKNISSVKIFDLTGRMVKSIQPNSESVAINLTELSSAMYIAKVTCEDNSQTEIKIFKK